MYETKSQSVLQFQTLLQNQASSHHRKIVTGLLKAQVFISSFLAYTSVHALRTTYSFSKSYIPNQIQVSEKMIGIIDSVMLLFIGFGNFIIAVRPLSKPIRALWIAMLLCAIEYCFVPLSIDFMKGNSAFVVLLVLMGLSGYLQSFTWPNLLPLVHSVCSPDQDSTILGFWATCPNFGNIIGFVVCQLIVLNNDLPWELSLYLIAIYMAINAIYISLRIQEMHPTNVSSIEPQQNPSVLEVFRNSLKVTLLTISFSLVKSVMYGILLWLPAYFYSIGLVDYCLYIPMTFDGASIVGSIILGAIFKFLPPNRKNTVLAPVLLFLLIFFIMLKIFDFTVTGYFIMIGLVGLCLGGCYNTMAGLVTIQLVRAVPQHLQTKYLRFYSALLMAIANVVTGITQVIIGFTVGQDQGTLFGIFVVYTAITLVSMLAVIAIQRIDDKESDKKTQLHQNKANGFKIILNPVVQPQINFRPQFKEIQFQKLN